MSGGILPGMSVEPVVNRQISKNRMHSNIFGVDDTIKTEYSRTSIGHDFVAKTFVEKPEDTVVENTRRDLRKVMGSIPIFIGSNKTNSYCFQLDENKNLKFKNANQEIDQEYQNYFFTNSLCTFTRVIDVNDEAGLIEALGKFDAGLITTGNLEIIVLVRTSTSSQYFQLLSSVTENIFKSNVFIIPVVDDWIKQLDNEAFERIYREFQCNIVYIEETLNKESLSNALEIIKANKIIPIISTIKAKDDVKYSKEILQSAIAKSSPVILSGVSQKEVLEQIHNLHHSHLSFPVWALLSPEYESSENNDSKIDYLSLSINSGLILGLKQDNQTELTPIQYAKKLLNQAQMPMTTVIRLLGENLRNFFGISSNVLLTNCLWSSDYQCKMLFRDGKMIYSLGDSVLGSGLQSINSLLVNNDRIEMIDNKISVNKELVEFFLSNFHDIREEANEKLEQYNQTSEKKDTTYEDQLIKGRGTRRNMHVSSFSLSGAQADDHMPQRTSIRTRLPPGGGTDTRLW